MRAIPNVMSLAPLFLGLVQRAGALEGSSSSVSHRSVSQPLLHHISEVLGQLANPFAELCAKKVTECNVICNGIVKKQSCSSTTGAWSCNCGVAPPKLSSSAGADSTEEVLEKFKKICDKKKEDCDTICKGSTEHNSCSSATGAWSCKCATASPSTSISATAATDELKLGSSRSAEPFKALCEEKKKGCDTLCKGATGTNTCSSTTGAWSCKCAAVPSMKTTVGTASGAGSAEPFKEQCEKKKTECETLCKGVVDEQSCSGTTGKWKCSCGVAPTLSTGAGSAAGHWSKFSVRITSSSILSLSTLLASIDTATWKVTKSVSVGHLMISVGDILLQEGAMAGKELELLASLKAGELFFKHFTKITAGATTTTARTSTETKTETKTSSWRKTGSWKKVSIVVESGALLKRLASSLDGSGGLTADLHVGGLKLHKGDHVLMESVKGITDLKSFVAKLKTLTSVNLVVDVRNLQASTSGQASVNGCASQKKKCGTRCGGAIAAWSCAFNSALGTKWSCQCAGGTTRKELASAKRTIEATITSKKLMTKILRLVDTKTMTFTKTVRIGKQTVTKGDRIEGARAFQHLTAHKMAHLKILHRKTQSEVKTDRKKLEVQAKVTKMETATPSPPVQAKVTKTESKTVAVGSGSIGARVKMLEELVIKLQTKVVSLESCAATCCKGQCAAASPMPDIKTAAPSPDLRTAAPSPKSSPTRTAGRRRRLTVTAASTAPGSRRRRRLFG